MLKRRFPPALDKKNRAPKPLKTKNFVYDLEENTNVVREPDLKLILTSFVEGNVFLLYLGFLLNQLQLSKIGVGLKNDIVSVRPSFGRSKLLLQGLAVYASPENLEKLKSELEKANNGDNTQALEHSSRYAELVVFC